MTQKKKIIILTMDAGFGHRRAALAIADALKKAYPEEVDCLVVNPLKKEGITSLIEKSQNMYDVTSREHRELYHMGYEAINNFPVSLFADQVTTTILFKAILDLIVNESPDGIISTFPIFSSPVSRVLKMLLLRIPFYSVVTDMVDVHKFWFLPGPEKFFVATDQLADQAVNNFVRRGRVVVSGIPIDTRIATETREKSVIRQDLGWDVDLPTVTAIGSKRVNNLLEKLVSIEDCDLPFQFCIVAGGDDDLYQAVSSRSWKVPVHCYNYVENIPELLLASDLLITKAGGLITSESLACGLPMIIIDSISGQESGNLQFLLNNHTAVEAKTNEELLKTVRLWLSEDQAQLKRYAENAKRLGKPSAAFQIAQSMVGEINANKYEVRNKLIWNQIQLLSELPSSWKS